MVMTPLAPYQIPTVSFYLANQLSAIHIASLNVWLGGYYTYLFWIINTIPTGHG
ncbi:hypothetical protein D3C77_230460 [compost metagenome]